MVGFLVLGDWKDRVEAPYSGGKNTSSHRPRDSPDAASPNAIPAAPPSVANSTGLDPLVRPTNADLDKPYKDLRVFNDQSRNDIAGLEAMVGE
jgi:hypothetical protein